MNFARKIGTVVAAWLLAVGVASPALAQLNSEPTQYFGHLRTDMSTQASTWLPGPVTDATGDVYNNTNPQAPALGGFTLTDLSAIFGDRVTTTGTGVLNENDFTIVNSGSSAGNLLTATYNISFYDGTSFAFLGGYNGNINFGSGLPPGFYAIITFTNLIPAAINLNTTNVLVTQQLVAKTGAATRLGVEILDPPSIGSSATDMFISSVQVGPAGFYNLGNPPINANPGYRINVDQSTSLTPSTWGRVKGLYH